MLKFDKKLLKFEVGGKVLAEIEHRNKTVGYIYFEEVENDLEVEEAESSSSDSESGLPLWQCEYCYKEFTTKRNKDLHLGRGSCKAKLIADYVKYSTKGKQADHNVMINKNSVSLGGYYKFKPVSDPNNRENILIIGPQNSGKSYFASMYAESYQKRIGNDVIIVSRIEDDQSFEDLKDPIRLRITEELLDRPIDIKNELAPSLTIFDDIDDSRNSVELSKYMWNLNSEALVNGRDQTGNGEHVYTITTLHITEGGKTRKILNEATMIVIFLPLGYQETRILKTYANLSPQQITKIKKLKSRWVAINCKYRPQYVLTEKQLFLLDEF